MAGFVKRMWNAIRNAPEQKQAQFSQFARNYMSGIDNRLTADHWGRVNNQSINADLAQDLGNIRQKARFERQNNAHLEGMVSSHALDVVGPNGPTLQVVSKNAKWAARLENIWREWWEMPDLNGQLSGPEMMVQAIRMEWDCGEFIWQIANEPSDDPVQMRLLGIHPRRLGTPYGMVGDPTVTLGIKRNATGKPLIYWFNDLPENEYPITLGTKFNPFTPDLVIHDYAVLEPGQARGVPLLAPCLDTIAQLRDFERDTMQAARMAAMWAVFFYTQDAEAAPMPMAGSVDVEPGSATALPPGYRAEQMTPQHPGANFESFRKAKLAEIGRAACMPYMTVALDSSGHNYSSARMDGQNYDAALKVRRGRFERRALDRILAAFRLEAQRANYLDRDPEDFDWHWTWTPRPHVDPEKEANAQHLRLADGTQTQEGACAENGLSYDIVQAKKAEESKDADKAVIDRIANIHQQIESLKKTSPTLKLDWSQIVAAPGISSAPGEYLKAVAASEAAQGASTDGVAAAKPATPAKPGARAMVDETAPIEPVAKPVEHAVSVRVAVQNDRPPEPGTKRSWKPVRGDDGLVKQLVETVESAPVAPTIRTIEVVRDPTTGLHAEYVEVQK